MNAKYPYFLTVVFGLITVFLPEIQPYPATLGIAYFLFGSVSGFLWPHKSWRWGIWISGPMIVLLGLSVLFGGQMEIFLKKDLPILLIAIISACVGSFLFALMRKRILKQS